MEGILKRNETLVRHVEESTSAVFSTMLDLNVRLEQVAISKDSTVSNAGLLATIGIAGPISGSGSLCLSTSFSCRIASRFLMNEYSEVNDEVLDAVAELANMIIGGLKSALEEDLGPMGLSIPTVVFSEHYFARSPSLSERLVLTFHCEEESHVEKFTILVCLISEVQNRSYLGELARFHASLA